MPIEFGQPFDPIHDIAMAFNPAVSRIHSKTATRTTIQFLLAGPPRRMQKKLGLATVTLALLAAARSIPDNLGYDGYQLHAAAGNNLTENDDFSWVFATSAESNANTIVKRHSKKPRERPLAPVATVKLSRNSDSWIGMIQVGTPRRNKPRQQHKVIVDTGSSYLWVTSYRDRKPAYFNKYNPRKSSTSQNLETPFVARYGSGSATGSTYYDTVKIEGIKVNMSLGSVTKNTAFTSNTLADGILGLSPLDPAHPESHFIHNVKEEYPEFNPVAAFYFGTGEPELHLGQVKEVYLGGIEYHPLVLLDGMPLWNIGGGDIIIGKNYVVVKGIQTFFDTGAEISFGPPEGVAKIYEHIPNCEAFQTEGKVQYHLPCNHVPKVSIRWNNGNPWSIQPEKSIIPLDKDNHWCLGPFAGKKPHPKDPENLWQLGGPFMQGKYIIFDAKDRRVGVAKAK